MASIRLNRGEQVPVISPAGRMDEFADAEREVSVMRSYSSLQDKKARRAELEDDIDILALETRDKIPPENQIISQAEMVNVTKLANLLSADCPRETQEMATVFDPSETLKTPEEPGESVSTCEDALLTPLPLISPSTEGVSSLEGESAEWISDDEMISDPTEDSTPPDIQNSQEWPKIPPLTKLLDRDVDSSPEEITGDNDRRKEKGDSTFRSPSETRPPDDVCAVQSTPFSDEREDEEEVNGDLLPCQQQCSTLDTRFKPSPPSNSGNISISRARTSALLAVPSDKQQNELLPHSQCGFAPREANQEAAQQVFVQDSPPLSTVAMELSNQGGAPSERSGWALVVSGRHNRERDKVKEERKQPSLNGAKEGGLERKEAVEQQHGRGLVILPEENSTGEHRTEKFTFVSSKHSRMETDSCDDSQSDSGVSADFSPCSTSEINTTLSPDTPAAAPKETPIEREIRRAVQRERSLRKSRGLPNPPTSPEYVEIPLRKTVVHQSVTGGSKSRQGKDSQLAGKKMQHEIQEEVQREEDLVKLGKVPGVYDKGTVRQLKERKQLFEVFQKPSDSDLTVPSKSEVLSWSHGTKSSTKAYQEDISPQPSTTGGSNAERTAQNQHFRGPGFTEGAAGQVIILESNLNVPVKKLYHVKPEAPPVTAVGSGAPRISSTRTGEEAGINGREQEQWDAEKGPKENPFFKLRPSTHVVKVEQDIQEAKEREKELQKQRVSLYGAKEGAEGRRETTRIEEYSPMLPSSQNGLAVPGSSSRRLTGPPTARQAALKVGQWPPVQSEEENINRPQANHSHRTPRQKTPLVKRWESGLVNGRNYEDN